MVSARSVVAHWEPTTTVHTFTPEEIAELVDFLLLAQITCLAEADRYGRIVARSSYADLLRHWGSRAADWRHRLTSSTTSQEDQ